MGGPLQGHGQLLEQIWYPYYISFHKCEGQVCLCIITSKKNQLSLIKLWYQEDIVSPAKPRSNIFIRIPRGGGGGGGHSNVKGGIRLVQKFT